MGLYWSLDLAPLDDDEQEPDEADAPLSVAHWLAIAAALVSALVTGWVAR